VPCLRSKCHSSQWLCLALPVVMCVAPCPGADGEAEQVLYMVKPSSHCEAL
jgi:hypothetical protein